MASEGSSASSAAAAILSSVLENIKNLPASSPAHSSSSHSRSAGTLGGPRFDSTRLFGRQRPVHDLLGGGLSADVLLWRKKNLSVGFLAGATAIWILFEWIGYHFVSVLSFFVLLAIAVLFAWSYLASILNRNPPPIPKFELSDETVLKAAKYTTVEVNRMLSILYDIATAKDPTRFVKLAGGLGLLVLFGSWFRFLSLVYLAMDEVSNQFKRVDTSMLSKIPRRPAVQKKAE